VLAALYRSEQQFRQDARPQPHYARLQVLKLAGLSPVGEGEIDPVSGYTFTSSAGTDAYTIVAIPPKSDMTTFSLMETGEMDPPRDGRAWRRALGKR
jgi:hypothetical protein